MVRLLSRCLLGIFTIQTLSLVASEVPILFWHSQPVQPTQTVMLVGANLSSETNVETSVLPDSSPGNPQSWNGSGATWEPTSTLQVNAQLIQAAMPQEPLGVVAFRCRNGTAAGSIRRINAPDPWFAIGDQGETASPGGWIGVFGTCLKLEAVPARVGPRAEPSAETSEPSNAPPPRLALVQNDRTILTVTARSSDGTRFGQFFDLPENVAPGTYQVFVHNGHGGPQGWSLLQDAVNCTPVSCVTILPRPPTPKDEVRISEISGENDDERFAKALTLIAQGGTLLVPAGHYCLQQPLVLPDRCLLRGEGMKRTCLEWTCDPVDAKGKSLPLVSGIELRPSKDSSDRRGSFSLEDLTLLASPTFTGTMIKRQGTYKPAHFLRIAVRAPNVNPNDARAESHSGNIQPLAISLGATRNLAVTGCEIDARNGVNLSHDGQSLWFSDNWFRWRNLNVWLMRGPRNIVFIHNRFTMAGTWSGNGYIKEDNANPGFSYAGYDRANARGLYFAHNVTDREEPDLPDRSIGLTTDKSGKSPGTGYCGRILAAQGTSLTLAQNTPPLDRNGKAPFQPGASVRIISGRGAGQSRLLVSPNTANVTDVEVDRPWEIDPDASSFVAISYFHGKALFVGNQFSCNPLLQTYFISEDLIYADNEIGVSGLASNVALWASGVLNSWHYQVIDNQVTGSGVTMKTILKPIEGQTGEDALLTCGQIYRNNLGSLPAAPLTIQIPDRTLGYLIEGNQGLEKIMPTKGANTLGLVRSNRGATPIP